MTDVVDIINGYEAWKAEQAFRESDALNYQRYLEVQKELRILKAARHYFEDGAADIEYLGRIFDGDEGALIEEEDTY